MDGGPGYQFFGHPAEEVVLVRRTALAWHDEPDDLGMGSRPSVVGKRTSNRSMQVDLLCRAVGGGQE